MHYSVCYSLWEKQQKHRSFRKLILRCGNCNSKMGIYNVEKNFFRRYFKCLDDNCTNPQIISVDPKDFEEFKYIEVES